MTRATTKTELVSAAAAQWNKMWTLIDSMTGEERSAAFSFDVSADREAHWMRDKNLRDVLVHIFEWHQLLLSWVQVNQGGGAAPFLPAPYNWKAYGEMNAAFWAKHQSTSCDDAKAILCGSHAKVLEVIEVFTQEELFDKKHFPWTGTTSLGSYCVSVTASHYDWAIKKIKRHVNGIRQDV